MSLVERRSNKYAYGGSPRATDMENPQEWKEKVVGYIITFSKIPASGCFTGSARLYSQTRVFVSGPCAANLSRHGSENTVLRDTNQPSYGHGYCSFCRVSGATTRAYRLAYLPSPVRYIRRYEPRIASTRSPRCNPRFIDAID